MTHQNEMPADSVRGRIRRFLQRHASELGNDVLEIGSRLHRPGCWWINNRDLIAGKWTGMDIQEGINVDFIGDVHKMPDELSGRFSGVLCSEVLEHVQRPWIALPEIRRVLKPGGALLVTTLTAFHIHGYPNDYYRYTANGLALLLEDAGFVKIHTEYGGEIRTRVKNHDQREVDMFIPMQIFAVAYAP